MSPRREAALYFRYEVWFQRRRGWRVRADIKKTILLDSDAPFRARTLSIYFREGDPSDIQHFLARYQLSINSPTPWFQSMPIPSTGTRQPGDTWGQYLIPEIEVDQKAVIQIQFRGEPFTPLKHRLVWVLAIDGVKIYRVPEVTS